MLTHQSKLIQIIFGFTLILFGLNGFFSFLPIPEKKGFAFIFLHTLKQSGYIMPTVATIMLSSGILLVLNIATNFGLLILFPISFNILIFHLFHDWQGLIAGGIIFSLNTFLICQRFNQFKLLFTADQI